MIGQQSSRTGAFFIRPWRSWAHTQWLRFGALGTRRSGSRVSFHMAWSMEVPFKKRLSKYCPIPQPPPASRVWHSSFGVFAEEVERVPPNMALQRTRRPRLRSGRSLRSLGSPLNARPLGDRGSDRFIRRVQRSHRYRPRSGRPWLCIYSLTFSKASLHGSCCRNRRIPDWLRHLQCRRALDDSTARNPVTWPVAQHGVAADSPLNARPLDGSDWPQIL